MRYLCKGTVRIQFEKFAGYKISAQRLTAISVEMKYHLLFAHTADRTSSFFLLSVNISQIVV